MATKQKRKTEARKERQRAALKAFNEAGGRLTLRAGTPLQRTVPLHMQMLSQRGKQMLVEGYERMRHGHHRRGR